MANFVHLHVHSEYSLLDGLTKIKKLISYTKELGMDSVALTDHGVLYGAIEFYKECQKQEIKPLLGLEGYITNSSMTIKDGREEKAGNHIVLIAKNYAGYQNLMKLSTIAHLKGYYYRPRFDKETLSKYKDNLICLSSCPKGEIGELIINGQIEKARITALWYQELFGENYYLEIQRHQYRDFFQKTENPKILSRLKLLQEEEDLWVQGTIKLSRELGIPLAATNDVHYLKQTDSFAQDVLVCISTGKLVSDIDRLRYVDTPTFYFRSDEEMQKIFQDVPDAVTNTLKIANQINLEIELGKWLFPKIEIPENQTSDIYLKTVASQRFNDKYPSASELEITRLEFELDIIIKKGYAPYFLMMADLVNWCTKQGIVTNTRGSAAGSIVSYVLGITTVDPLKYGLPFERFLNPFRPKPPDIDLDIADNQRELAIRYLVEKYGQDKVAQICTFGRMLARASVRDVGRVLGHPYSFPDKIAKLIPMGSQGFPMTIKHAIEISPELKVISSTDPQAKQVLEVAQEIEGNARHASVHAAGIVVSPEEITNFTPLQLEPNGEKIITQYEMHACEDVGLVKFDLLGIRNLSILTSAIQIIEKNRQIKIDLEKLPLDDKLTFEMLARGETMGVFQLGGSGMTKWLIELKPNRIEDLMAMIALFRPGPMQIIPEFIARKNKLRKITPIHPKMRDILEKSYGLLVYQDDILFTAIELAGYNWETVDKLRNAIGKKIPEEMAKQHEIFVDGCIKTSNTTKEEAEKIWDLFVPFQGYGFNKAHAASYGFVSYQTAYLKAHYPVEYMTALLTAESGDTEKITEGIQECRRMGIKVLPPDINKSQVGFSIEEDLNSQEGKAIRFGLSAIKNVGEAAISAILEARDREPFYSLGNFCLRVNQQKVNKKVLESLIKVGTLDMFGKRSSLLAGLEQIRQEAENKVSQKSQGQVSLFSADEPDSQPSFYKDNLPQIEEFSKQELLNLEKELLGFYLTEHPLTPVLSLISSEVNYRIGDLLNSLEEVDRVKIGGIIIGIRTTFTKKNNSEMAFATIEDQSGKIEVIVFPKVFAETKKYWIKDQIIIVEGKLENREDKISIIVEKANSLSSLKTNGSSSASDYETDFIIRIPKGTNPAKLVRLNELLKKNPGKQKGALIFENNGQSKKLHLNFGVEYTISLERLINQELEAL